MNVVDSSGWLEFLSDGPNANDFSEPLTNIDDLIVPSICVYEVFKVVLRERNEDSALLAVSLMKQGKTVDLSFEIAAQAAKVSHDIKIPMADSIILTTAQLYDATIWTQDSDFKNLDNVKLIGCTNRRDVLDSAITRPGRLDRLIEVPNPDCEGIEEIFKIHTKNMNFFLLPLTFNIVTHRAGVSVRALNAEIITAIITVTANCLYN